MSYKPQSGCKYPLCSSRSIKGSSYCNIHKNIIDKQRPTPTERGYDYKWQRFRKEYLKRNPFCFMCLNKGKPTQSKVIDHIIPHKEDKGLFWDESNMQALCIRCHNRKTGQGGKANTPSLDRINNDEILTLSNIQIYGGK